MVLKEGTPGLNFTGGEYDEYKFILQGEDGRLYVSYTSSSDFDFCPLWGVYTDCVNCSWWWERWLNWCGDREEGDYDDLYPCQNPEMTLIETPERIFRARPLLPEEEK